MDFHRIPAENLRDQIFQLLIDNGKIIDGETIDDLKKLISFDDMEQPITENSEDNAIDITPVVSEVFNDNINDDNDDNDDNESSPKPKSKPKKKEKKPKKEKSDKPKKEKSDKPSKPASSFIFFKSHPDNQAAINEAAGKINEETGKPFGISKGSGIVWRSLSEEDQKIWGLKSKEAFEQSQTNLAG